ncbi:alpha 1,4-glycosyltransferase family protein [Wolffia australiana]
MATRSSLVPLAMLRSASTRRRPRRRRHLCYAAAAAAFFLLLLYSIAVLPTQQSSPSNSDSRASPDAISGDSSASDDRIDALDVVDESEAEIDPQSARPASQSSQFFWDHSAGAMRRSLGVPLDRRDLGDDFAARMKVSFASDDQPVDQEIRSKLGSVRSIEDALLIKTGGPSPLREGWATWFEAKGRYLRQDRMFRSGMELMNPMNHPLLQDPDGDSLTGLSRGDRLLKKLMLKDLNSSPFVGSTQRKVLGTDSSKFEGLNLDERSSHIYPDGSDWGFYPGIERYLSFSDFVGKFVYAEDCSLRVFMVWNNPPWAFGVRYWRALESLLHHHKDACVLVFSETLELDFFADFVRDGFKIAAAMPNLDELLEATPVHGFASVWHNWRKTRYYPLHSSEVIRLAALYKYGGVYLDWDVIVLKPLSSLKNSVGVENEINGYPVLNGAVMAFDKHSPFLMECMKELHTTYDSNNPSWNGVQLLTRVVRRLSGNPEKLQKEFPLNLEPTHKFFPINANNIIRYFSAPVDEADEAQQSNLLTKILNESVAFHFWNGSTFFLVPEAGSLSEKIINMYCLRCIYLL